MRDMAREATEVHARAVEDRLYARRRAKHFQCRAGDLAGTMTR